MKRGNGPVGATESLASGNVRAGRAGRVVEFLQNEIFSDFVSCLLLSSGLALAITRLTVLDGGLWRILGFTAASLTVIALLRNRWWVAPVAIGLLLTGTAAYRLVLGDLRQWAEYISGFLRWAWYGADPSDIYGDFGLIILEAALAFGMALVVFVAVRRFFAFPLAIVFPAAVLIFVYAVVRTDISTPVCLTAAGVIVMLPRVYAGYVKRKSESSQSRGTMQLMAVPAALLALLLAFAVIPKDTDEWRSRGLNNFFSDVRYLLSGSQNAYPDYASNFSLDKVDFQSDNSRLGGPVSPGVTHIATVKATQPVLLRGAVRDYYTGESWLTGAPDGDLRFQSLFWRRYRRETYDLDKPVGGEARRLFDSLTNKAKLELRYLDNRFSALFAAGRVQNISISDRRLEFEPFFNVRGEVYTHVLIPRLIQTTVETTLWMPRSPDFDEAFLRLEQLTASGVDEGYERFYGRYTQLPDTLPETVREMSASITGGLESPYKKARAIETWLMQNCEYTLEPEILPEGEDFVARFIETREGYCTYYASAMTVMARCAGLPSRYVSGFALESNPFIAGEYFISERTAHAWTEVYFYGIGWMEFDPLSWDVFNPLNSDVETVNQPSSASDAQGGLRVEHGTENGRNIRDDKEADGAASSDFVFWIAAFGLIAFYILLRVALYAAMTGKTRTFRLERMLRCYPEISLCLERYYSDILRQLRLMGLEPRPGETLTTFPARVDKRLRFEAGTLAEIAGILTRMHFAGIEPSFTDAETAAEYHKQLEAYLQESMNKTAYFFRRAIR